MAKPCSKPELLVSTIKPFPLFSAALSQQVSGYLVNNPLPNTVILYRGKTSGVESQGRLYSPVSKVCDLCKPRSLHLQNGD